MQASIGTFTFSLWRDVRYPPVAISAKGERKRLNAGIKELDFKSPVFYRSLLPDELVHSRLPDFADAIGIGIDSVIIAGSSAIQSHFEAHRRPVFCWS